MKPQLRFSRSPHDRAVSRLVARTWLPAPIETIFGFFADASNLEKLTPAWLRFRIVTIERDKFDDGSAVGRHQLVIKRDEYPESCLASPGSRQTEQGEFS